MEQLTFDALIIGAGPAGISASLYLSRAGFTVCAVYNGGGALDAAESIGNYYGFNGSGADLFNYGLAQAAAAGVTLIRGEVTALSLDPSGVFSASLASGGKIEAKAALIATGSPRSMPNIPGLADYIGRGVSFCAVCDGFFYRGKDVAVVGAGEYAKSEAAELAHLARSVTVLTNGAQPEADFSGVNILTEKIERVLGGDRVESILFKDGETLRADGIFVASGVAGAADFASRLGIAMEGKSIIADGSGATNVPGLFAAGDATGGIKQVATAVRGGCAAGLGMINFLRGVK